MNFKPPFIILLCGAVLSLAALPTHAVEVSIPNLTAESGESVVIPIEISEITGLRSMALTVAFNPAIITIDAVKKGDLVSNFLIAYNESAPGTLRIVLAAARDVKGAGDLVLIHATVNPNAKPGDTTPLKLTAVRINGGEIPVTAKDGELMVDREVGVARRKPRLTTWGRLKRQP
jgi:hypothetical protein